jgi:cell division protein FtsB
VFYNARHREKWERNALPRQFCVLKYPNKTLRRVWTMKKLLTLLFAVALAFSLSAVSFAQDTGGEKKAETKKEEKAEKKAAKKKAKKEKKEKKADTMKDDSMKK